MQRRSILFNGMIWVALHPNAQFDYLDYIPSFLSASNPKSATQQIHDSYGWEHFSGFTLQDDGKLKYPGDPPITPLFYTKLRGEEIIFYQYAWLLVKQPDGKWEVCRVD